VVVEGAIALVALAAVVASLGYLHLAPTGLSPVRDAVSQYGITPYRAGYRVATVSFAISGVALALGLDRAITSPGRGALVAALIVFAAARAVISWFPMDAPGSTPTSTGVAHGVLALLAFGGATFAAFRLGALLAGQTVWSSLAPVSTGLAWAMLAALVLMGLARSHPIIRARFGIVERGFYVAAIAWFAVFAIACAANSR
jgi:Protein of unknown function (DUF998)